MRLELKVVNILLFLLLLLVLVKYYNQKESEFEIHPGVRGVSLMEKASKDLMISHNVESNEDLSQVKVAIVTLYHGSSMELKSVTEPEKQKYCEIQGYDYINAFEEPAIRDLINHPIIQRNFYAIKFYAIKYYFEKYDYIMWSDADSIFWNKSRSLSDAGILDPNFELVLATGHPQDWKWGMIVNLGHFLMKRSEWSLKFLNEAINAADSPHCPPQPLGDMNSWQKLCLEKGDGTGAQFWLSDQSIVNSLLRSSENPLDFACHVKWVNMRDMNSEVPWYSNDDLVIHTPGRPNRDRITFFNDIKTNGIPKDYHPKDWRVNSGLFNDYKGAGWNIPCKQLLTDINNAEDI